MFIKLKYAYHARKILKSLFDCGLETPYNKHFKEVFTKPELWILCQIAKYRHWKYDRAFKKYIKLKRRLMID